MVAGWSQVCGEALRSAIAQPFAICIMMGVRSCFKSLADSCDFLCRKVAFKLLRPADLPCDPRYLLTVHIGHHFWGAGNVGDDFMLAGFLVEMRRAALPVRFTCCVPYDNERLARRHPEVEWKPYTLSDRWSAIKDADCWLGLGDTPLQIDSGDWLEQHLDMEREICECLNKPMYFLGVGVGNVDSLQRPKYKRLIKAAVHFWGRDEMSASWLDEASDGKASPGADMANILFAQHTSPLIERSTGYLMHFEDRSFFSEEGFLNLIKSHSDLSSLWLVQESRCLRWSEKALWQELPASVQAGLRMSEPRQDTDDIDELLDSWSMPEVLISSRYHGALLAAWSGSSVVIINRNDKLTGLARQLGITSVAALNDAELLIEAIRTSKAVSQESLRDLARKASCSVHEWLQHAVKSTEARHT
ncbi:MAG: polysaccharide pyruvyl transferase family protein [Prosthecobacter sp.]